MISSLKIKKFAVTMDTKERCLIYSFLKLIIVCTSCLMIMSSSCNNCPTVAPAKYEDEIVFSAYPIIGDNPSVFGIQSDGTGMREIVKNAIVYSGSSKENTLAVVRHEPEGVNAIIVCNTDGDSIRRITAYNYTDGIEYAIISPDGKQIAFFDGNDTLWMAHSTGQYRQIITDACLENTRAVFSHDSKKIAIFEKNADESILKVVIRSVDNPDNIIFEKEYNNAGDNQDRKKSLSWSINDEYICYVITDSQSENDSIYYCSIDGKNEYTYLLETQGAEMPSFSNDGKQVCFSARDGNIYRQWDYTSDTLRRLAISNLNENVSSLICPQWSNSMNEISYIHMYNDMINEQNCGRLEIIYDVLNTKIKDREVKILCDNVITAFWLR